MTNSLLRWIAIIRRRLVEESNNMETLCNSQKQSWHHKYWMCHYSIRCPQLSSPSSSPPPSPTPSSAPSPFSTPTGESKPLSSTTSGLFSLEAAPPSPTSASRKLSPPPLGQYRKILLQLGLGSLCLHPWRPLLLRLHWCRHRQCPQDALEALNVNIFSVSYMSRTSGLVAIIYWYPWRRFVMIKIPQPQFEMW